ncbi:hypothetical protein [Sulfuricurvum sp.]|uniref:hypothetical protein n=1 Tax=Sulfuricurvum sp. TaxID=2025608 RepID=UPI00261E20B2|nr:hypothetical protein [Sulfuricurvum sp.]MDD3596989.1 hypothetical protein [Sulfuricurvum sp.]
MRTHSRTIKTMVPNNSKGPEQLKYEAWLKDQIDNHGLIEIHATLNPEANNLEEVYEELNNWNSILDNPATRPTPRIEVKYE